ncbi:hypothetical protein [Pseudarthrobacter sp. MM222]|uniref:hypothetical protein n=1 Tax=Pseudarthrobacter sp. MM222 TaxID=3018929 RepID=UPI00221E3E23|nr:hypothetical protein [Pseudarthrobacter sp. MM222]
MSNPDDVRPPQQPGAQPPQPGNLPPTGSEPAPAGAPAGPPAGAGYQPPQQGHYVPPQGYQPPPQGHGQAPGYQPPGQPGAPGGFRFEMPADRPRNVNDVLPQGGFSGMFSVASMPTELKVSYWIWLIGGLLGLLGGVIGLFGSFVLLTVAPGIGIVVLLLVLVALALAAAQFILAMKMKEGREWARLALTILAGVSLLLTIISASATDGRSGSSWPGFIISLAATVLMWLPNSQAWFASLRGRV